MSNHARRVLAFGVCVALGIIAMLEGIRRLSPGGNTVMLGGGLVLASMFLLLSAVGLARPWLGKKRR